MHIKTVGAYEAKTHLSALLDSVAAGERVIITRKGLPIAIMMPYHENTDSVEQSINALLSFRSGKSLGGLKLTELKNDGRKY